MRWHSSLLIRSAFGEDFDVILLTDLYEKLLRIVAEYLWTGLSGVSVRSG